MTVAELIAELQKWPGDMDVCTDDTDFSPLSVERVWQWKGMTPPTLVLSDRGQT